MALAEKNPEAPVIRKDDGPVRNLIINRPLSYNALSIACMEALIREFEALSEDRSVSVVILSGAGKGFCAGHD
ncbi:MAG: enoyl-CoA hydratase/isomerase family protein, partial [Candidatus Dadabacteria bacterium]|nr:enoyl-CoA hydratase/isomerase family protein [Candidatus Dadabacteria bacterium]